MTRLLLWQNNLGCRLLVLGVILAFTAGCTAMRTVPMDSENWTARIKEGEPVRILTRDGRQLNFTVKHVDAERIDGADQSVRVDEIETLEHKEYTKTTNIIAVICLGALMVILYGSAIRNAGSVGIPAVPLHN